MIYLVILFLFFFLISYEFLIFNEEFFIAFTFFSFFFAVITVISNLLVSFYEDDKNKIFHFVSDEIFVNYNFFQNYLSYFLVLEYNKEFLYQYLNFFLDGVFTKFISFYDNLLLNNDISIIEKLPDFFYNFSEKILSSIVLKFQQILLEYFHNKWDFLILNDVLISLENENSFSENNIYSDNDNKG